MKTQKIVLALALVAVTPAVLAAQENGNAYNKSTNEVIASNNQQTSSAYFGPGTRMLYVADNALARIRKNHQEQKQEKQEPVQTKKNDTTPAPAYNPYSGPEGHMLVHADLHKNKSGRPQRDTTDRKTSSATTTHKTSSNYNPYVGPEGHRAAIGNAVRDAKHDSTTVPTHVRDIDTLSTNHQVILNSKTADKSARNTNKTFRHYLNEIGQAIAQEARYSK